MLAASALGHVALGLSLSPRIASVCRLQPVGGVAGISWANGFYADIAALRPAIHGKTEDLISQLGALANSRSRKVQVDSQHPKNPVADALRNALQRQRTAYLAHPVPSLEERLADLQ